MATDFGAKDRPTWRRGQRMAFLRWIGGYAGLVAGLLLFASLPTSMALSVGDPNGDKPPRAEGGPACPAISKAQFFRGWKAEPRVIHFQGVAFTRRRGDASCGMAHDGLIGRSFPVCEFDAPVELAVAAGGREVYFDVRPGYTAVIEARPDGPRCTITGLFQFYPARTP
jgi:hypothetical protein